MASIPLTGPNILMTAHQPVPTNLITGFLGVGKTTAVRSLLAQRPSGERWAVLVNEYGEVGLDEAILDEHQGEGVVIRELAGGCFCCTLSLPLGITLKEILRVAQPDRLLIESTGLGHPAGLLDTLRSGDFAHRLQVRATLCLVDPRDHVHPLVKDSPVFRDQLHMADVVAINKTDVVDPVLTADVKRYVEAFFPPKLLVVTTTQGQMDSAWLDLDADPLRAPLFPQAHAHAHRTRSSQTVIVAPGKPYRCETEVEGLQACGWIFSREDLFDPEALHRQLAGGSRNERLKGVFRIAEDDWILIHRVKGQMTVETIAYRRDSRLEVLCPEGKRDWLAFERDLLACRLPDLARSN